MDQKVIGKLIEDWNRDIKGRTFELIQKILDEVSPEE